MVSIVSGRRLANRLNKPARRLPDETPARLSNCQRSSNGYRICPSRGSTMLTLRHLTGPGGQRRPASILFAILLVEVSHSDRNLTIFAASRCTAGTAILRAWILAGLVRT